MFRFLIELIILLMNISSSLFDEYLCPINAYGWMITNNKSKEIYPWIYDNKTREFNRKFSFNSTFYTAENSRVLCFDIHQRMYQAININRKDFEIDWQCDYNTNRSDIKIKSWLFNQTFSPKKIYLQIKDYYRTKIIQTENNNNNTIKIKQVDMNIIKQIFQQLFNPGLLHNNTTIFYELFLDYGQNHGSINVQLRPIFKERLYILPVYRNHKNDSYIDIDCLSTKDIDIHSISWFNFTSILPIVNLKLHLQYSQIFSSQLSCVINDCFTYIITYIRLKYI